MFLINSEVLGLDEANMLPNVSDLRVLNPAVIERLRESLGSDADDILDETVAMFFTDSDTHLHAAYEAVQRGDQTALRHLAHRIKGSALQLGAERMVHVASSLETAAQNGDATGEVSALVDSLMQTFTQTQAALRQLGFGESGD
jgi:HPt (histidine-containing phosphotransfer) domain-containing protein